MIEKQNVVVGVPVGAEGYTPGPDYSRATCQLCDRQVWIGKEQRRYCRNHPLTPIACAYCLMEAVRRGITPGKINVLNPNSGSRYEPPASQRVAT